MKIGRPYCNIYMKLFSPIICILVHPPVVIATLCQNCMGGLFPTFLQAQCQPRDEDNWYFSKRFSVDNFSFCDRCRSGDEYIKGLKAWEVLLCASCYEAFIY